MRFVKSALLSMVFVSNLTVGSTGSEVVSLQQFLVTKGYLEIPAGVSYGYFGPLTKSAVAKWQSNSGISPAAGYFGPISRATMETQIAIKPVVPTTPTSTPITAPTPAFETDTPHALGMRANRVMLFRVYPFEARPGDFVTLDGSGFSKTINKVYFNGGNPITATSTNGTTLVISVPTNLAEGEYGLSVSNVLGSSDNPGIDIVIKVTSNPQPAPTIESALIIGVVVTLVGNGFTSANNLYTTFGNSSGPVSSNGTTLTFRIADLSLYEKIKSSTKGVEYQAALWIYVQNEHGVNKNPYKLETII